MNIETLRNYCLSKEEVTEEFPFGEDTLVYKVRGKIFAITSLDDLPLSINLKMNPEIVPEWRDKYIDVQPGYHMNKKHWNTVNVEGHSIPEGEIYWMIDHSYNEVMKKLPKKRR